MRSPRRKVRALHYILQRCLRLLRKRCHGCRARSPHPSSIRCHAVAAPKAPPAKKAAAAAPAAASPAAAGGEGTGIFVKGLPFESTEEGVREAFEAYGTITSFDLPRFEDSGRLRGIARITFATAQEATAALELNGSDFGGRSISVEVARPVGARPAPGAFGDRPPSEPSVTVFLGNLPFDADENMLREAFAECGEIFSVRIATDRETGAPRGFGHIEFADLESSAKAVALAGTPLNGRPVRVDYAGQRAEGGGGGRGGGRGGFGGDRGGRGGFGGRGGGRGGFGDRGGRGGGFRGGRGGARGGFNPNKGTIANFEGKKMSFE